MSIENKDLGGEAVMSSQPAFLLKISDGGTPATYSTIAGLRETTRTVWSKGMNIDGSGIFTGTAGETRLKSNALGGVADDYELSFDNGERVRGRFLVARLDYQGEQHGERKYALSLESVGPVEPTATQPQDGTP